jgi:hypothetical protein
MIAVVRSSKSTSDRECRYDPRQYQQAMKAHFDEGGKAYGSVAMLRTSQVSEFLSPNCKELERCGKASILATRGFCALTKSCEAR